MCPPAPRWLRRIWYILEEICAVHLERAPSGRRYAPPILCGGSHGGEQAEINWKRARLSVGCRRDCAQAARSQMPRHEGQVTQYEEAVTSFFLKKKF